MRGQSKEAKEMIEDEGSGEVIVLLWYDFGVGARV
jgi:hypothetical protein